jgi:threonine 3-dehydrogenase
MYETWHKMLAMLLSGLDVTPVVTHRLPMAQFETGFSALYAGQACKVILDISA